MCIYICIYIYMYIYICRCLRNIMSWAESREVFNDECEKIRIRFDAGIYHIHLFINIYIYLFINVYIVTCINMCIFIYVYIYIYI
jgi:hypothetical protein